MKSSGDNPGSIDPPSQVQAERTGLPGLRTWRGVYLFAFGCFVLWVLLLLALTLSYS